MVSTSGEKITSTTVTAQREHDFSSILFKTHQEEMVLSQLHLNSHDSNVASADNFSEKLRVQTW